MAGFVIESLGAQVKVLGPLRDISPWHWFLGSQPLHNGLTWQAWMLPLAVSVALNGDRDAVFVRRDLR